MSLTMKQRSQLVRTAEHRHNKRQRPASFAEIVMAEYNEPRPIQRQQPIRVGRIALVLVALVVLWGVM